MPIYTYRCVGCNHEFEVIQKFSDKPIDTCTVPGCGGEVKKQMTSSNFHLKGTGWYKTDYQKRKR